MTEKLAPEVIGRALERLSTDLLHLQAGLMRARTQLEAYAQELKPPPDLPEASHASHHSG